MDAEFHEWGKDCSSGDLGNPLAVSMLSAIERYPFVTLVTTKLGNNEEGLIVDFSVELPQEPPVDIRASERLLLRFPNDASERPIVNALRCDFPDDVLHLNLTVKGEPKELCIFEQDYRELRSRVTARLLLDRVGDWLARAAVELHHLSDQPLEPFILTSERIIIDRDAILDASEKQTLFAVQSLAEKPTLLQALPLPEDFDPSNIKEDVPLHLVLPLVAEPWHCRVINHQPTDFHELAELLEGVGIDLQSETRDLITRVQAEGKLAPFKKFRLITVIALPKTRAKNGPVESMEWWSFMVLTTVEELSLKLGMTGQHDGHLVPILGDQGVQDMTDVLVYALRPTYSLSRQFAQDLSGISAGDVNIVSLGAGALGSQVALNLARQGFGKWTLIDDDRLLPHNLTRHALSFHGIGCNKAESVAFEICGLMNDRDAAQGLDLDVLAGAEDEQLSKALADSDIILDCSASHAVSRHISLWPSDSARCCAFVGPDARYLTILFEGQQRTTRLDDLAIQLSVGIIERRHLHDVFAEGSGTVSFAGSCRDASAELPQDTMAIQANTAAQFIRSQYESVSPCISIWEWSPERLSLIRHELPVHTISVIETNGWTLRLSSQASSQMRHFRRQRLPRETGGVLLGSVDHEHQTVYVGMVLPSPPDSVEWPDAYIRGVRGLKEQLDEISHLTGGDLVYVGEWHSHPEGSDINPSGDDQKAHAWLVEELGKVGLPGVVLIQGDVKTPHAMVALE